MDHSFIVLKGSISFHLHVTLFTSVKVLHLSSARA
jgi:hypothetical protein